MYTCSKCYKEVEIVPGIKAMCCEGATVLLGMGEVGLHGHGAMNEVPVVNNNLSDTSAAFLKQMASMIIGVEFFKEEKTELYAKDIVIADTNSGRSFSLTLTVKEL